MADRFFTPDVLPPGEYVLTGSEAHHLATVRRFKPGQRIVLFNGDGNEYPAEIIALSKKTVVLHVAAPTPTNRELGFPLVVASALPKGDRNDFLLEKLTELGVTRFIPLITERSVVRPKDSAVEKFHRAVVEASKQCGRNSLMVIDRPHTWAGLLAMRDLPGNRYLLHTEPGASGPLPSLSGVVVAIGPEGGFTPGEVDEAARTGWRTSSLGPRILRVETAAVAAAALLGTGVGPVGQ